MLAGEASNIGTTSHPRCYRDNLNGPEAVRRIPAKEIESLVVKAVRIHFKISNGADDAAVIRNHVVRIEVQSHILVVEMVKTLGNGSKRKHGPNVVEVPWRKTASTRHREIFVPESQRRNDVRP